MQQWEYAWSKVSREKVEKGLGGRKAWCIYTGGRRHRLVDGLDLLGKQGWELVATHVSQTGPNFWHYPDAMYVFKRPLEPELPPEPELPKP